MPITSAGIGSGLDVNGLISKLMTLEKQPLNNLTRKEAGFQAKLSAFGQIKGALSSLQNAAQKLKDIDQFGAKKAQVNGSEPGFSATSTTTAAASSYSVEVQQLAQTQRIATSATSSFVPDTSSSATGTLQITFGSYEAGTPPNFNADNSRQKTLEFSGSTLEELRDAINDDDSLGVKANIIDNGTAKQLVLTGNDTGKENAFKLTGSGSLSGLSFDPSATTSSSDPLYGLQNAQNSKLKLDGIEISRGNNTVSDAIEGVTLKLDKVTGNNATLAINDDLGSAKSGIDSFVKAYNETVDTLKNLTNYDTKTQKGSVLTGDSTARTLQGQLRAMVGDVFAGAEGTERLSDIGITFNRDGKLSVDSSKLSEAMEDPTRNVAAFFAGVDKKGGFARTIADKLDNYLGNDGLISGRTDGINESIKAIGRQRETLESRLITIEARYRKQYTALDTAIASMTRTSTYLNQQLANLPKIT